MDAAEDNIKEMEIKKLQKQISGLILDNSKLESKLDLTCQALREESQMRLESDSHFKEVSKSLNELKNEKKNVNIKAVRNIIKIECFFYPQYE